MIQQSINQLLGGAAIALRASPIYQRRVEAREIAGKAKSAMSGLKKIQEGLNEPGKSLSQTEISDIKARTAELNRNVYDAKIRSHKGDVLSRYLSGPVSRLPHQAEYTQVLQDIEKNIDIREKAMQSMMTKGQDALSQGQKFEQLKDDILNHRQKRILEMKSAAARNENREKALEAILPKGGSTPLTESEGFNPESQTALTKMEEQKAAATEQKEDVQELKDIVEGKVEMPKEEQIEGEEEDMYMSDEDKEFWEKRYKPIRDALDSKDYRKNIDSVLKEFGLNRETFFNDDAMQRAAYDLFHKPIRRVVADAEYTLKKNPGADRDAVFDSEVYKPILERAIEQESQPYRTPKPIYTEEEKAEIAALEKEHYELDSRYKSTGITKKELERLKSIESELATLRTKNNVGTSSYVKGEYTDAAKNLMGTLEDLRQRYLAYVEEKGLKNDEEKEFYEKVKKDPEVFYEEYVRETRFPEHKKKIPGVEKTHYKVLSGNTKHYFDLIVDPEGGGFLESPDKEYREEIYKKLKKED